MLAEIVSADTSVSLGLLLTIIDLLTAILTAVVGGIVANVWQLATMRTAFDIHVAEDKATHAKIESRFQRHSDFHDLVRQPARDKGAA